VTVAPGRRTAASTLAALGMLGAAVTWAPAAVDRSPARPNVIVVLTDDQPADTFGLMPWLAGELQRPGSRWSVAPYAYANTPLCCPARATLLTGRYAHRTGVVRNEDGAELDESMTLATRLRDAGYRTALVGKYLNRYPFGRLPYVPAGWDRLVAKRSDGDATVYHDFDVVDQGSPGHVRRAYATDWLADRAIEVIRSAPPDRPLFLLFAPTAPHSPWVPAPRHVGTYADLSIEEPPNVGGALRGAPAWVRRLPVPSATQRAAWIDARRRAAETLLALDDALRRIVGALGDRLDETLIVVLSDHGYSFGEHRWAGKKCPYEACVRIPLAVRSPWAGTGLARPVVSLVDVAPTILALAGAAPNGPVDGASFDAWIRGRPTPPFEARHRAAFLEWAGDRDVPAWTAVRTRDLKLIRYADGAEELYDLGGAIGAPDPWETWNRVGDPRYARTLERLRELLAGFTGPDGVPG
jgi:N-acetylglucosamine-6-sulfatase